MVLKDPSSYDKGKTIVYLVRHGDYDEDRSLPRIPGTSLSPKGIKQAKLVAKEFSKIKDEIDVVYTSKMARAIETAEIIEKSIGKKAKQILELSEINRIIATNQYHKTGFWKHMKRYAQAKKAFNKILKKEDGKVILIVVHGNIIRSILGNKLKMKLKESSKLAYNNCHVTKARFHGTRLERVYAFNLYGLKYNF